MSLKDLGFDRNYGTKRINNTMAAFILSRTGLWVILCLLIVAQVGCSKQNGMNTEPSKSKAMLEVWNFQFVTPDDIGNIKGAKLLPCGFNKADDEKYALLTLYNPSGTYLPMGYILKEPSGAELRPQCVKSGPFEWERVSATLLQTNGGVSLLYVTKAAELSTDFNLLGVGNIPREALK